MQPFVILPIPTLPVYSSESIFATNNCKGSLSSPAGSGIVFTIVSNKGFILSLLSFKSVIAYPFFADAYTTLKSSCSSDALRSMKSSKTSSTTSVGLAPGLSTLFTTTIGTRLSAKALLKTNLVCGIGPSKASTTSITPSTILSTRSTSPPKSACPGVSTIFIFISLYFTAVFFDRIVIPLSFSISFESITLSATCSFSLKVPLCFKRASTSVVLP